MDATFHLPADLAEELVAEGLANRYEPPLVKVGGATMLSVGDVAAPTLIMLSVGADIVAVTGIRAPLAVIAERISQWTQRAGKSGRKYALLAIGPRGQLRLDLDDPPDSAAITALLDQIYEDH